MRGQPVFHSVLTPKRLRLLSIKRASMVGLNLDDDLSIVLELRIWASPVSHRAEHVVCNFVFNKYVFLPDAVFAH